MFTRNWYVMASSGTIGQSIPTNRNINPLRQIKSIDGEIITDVSLPTDYEYGYSINNWHPYNLATFSKAEKSSWYADKSSRSSSVSAPYGVVFGNGTDPESIDSYTMSGDILTKYTATCTRTLTYADGQTEIKYDYTITNNEDTDFTISEIGLLGYAYQDYKPSTYSHYYYYYNILFERTLLETPVTIPAGGVGQVSYTLRMNYPTA